MDCKLPSSSVHGTSQARILEGIAVSFSSECSWPRDQTWVSYIAGSHELHTDSLLTEPPEKPLIYAKYTSVKILQAGVLEWVAMSFSRRSSQPRDWTRVSRIAGRCFTIWANAYIYIYILLHILSHHGLSEGVEHSSTCCTAGPCFLSTFSNEKSKMRISFEK